VTYKKDLIIRRRTQCEACGSVVNTLIELPSLPLTDTYSRDKRNDPILGIDQAFQYCEKCGHGQLENLVSPRLLYEEKNYGFRTSASTTARRGSDFFMSVLDEATKGREFKCVLDVGCNDLFLLRQLKDRSHVRIGIDPILHGHEQESLAEGIVSIGKTLDATDPSELPGMPDLVVCRHTLEHVLDPIPFVETLLRIADDNALFVFELPGFDALIERMRFDQVFHQHVNYFAKSSFQELLRRTGCVPVVQKENYHDWGAMAIAFRKGKVGVGDTTLSKRQWTVKGILSRYETFRLEIGAARAALEEYSNGNIFGYGAAQMLPVLGYHMGTDFAGLQAVLDDDLEKDGMGYWNLPVRIMHSGKVDSLSEATVLITAFDNVAPIMLRLLSKRPRHLILPLNVI
jgi:hypothetical protein